MHTYLESYGFDFVNFENKDTVVADANYVKGNKVKELTLKIFYGGLGDHLTYSPLPRIAKQVYGYDKVYISNHSNYNNPATKKLVWEHNPFVDGFNNSDSDYPKFGSVPIDKNMLDVTADFFNLSSDARFLEPEIYYKPKILYEYQNAIIFEPNTGNAYGIPTVDQVKSYFVNKNLTYQMKSLKGHYPQLAKILTTRSLRHFCDIIFSCKRFYCFTSGVATLSAALGKSTTVLYANDVTPINPMFHHSKLHTYERLG